MTLKIYESQGKAVEATVNSKEENSYNFCLDFVQEFGLGLESLPPQCSFSEFYNILYISSYTYARLNTVASKALAYELSLIHSLWTLHTWMLSVLSPTASSSMEQSNYFARVQKAVTPPRLEEGANGFRKCFELTYFLWFPTTPPSPSLPPPVAQGSICQIFIFETVACEWSSFSPSICSICWGCREVGVSRIWRS